MAEASTLDGGGVDDGDRRRKRRCWTADASTLDGGDDEKMGVWEYVNVGARPSLSAPKPKLAEAIREPRLSRPDRSG